MAQLEKRYPFDISTIDQEKLAAYPIYKEPPTYHLQREPGNGCSGDPPGFPTYFTQSVYTPNGNIPPRGPVLVLLGRALPRDFGQAKSGERYTVAWQRAYKELWRALPLDHPRTRAWILSHYKHSAHCYRDPEGEEGTIIFPVPDWKLRTFKDNSRFSDNWREKAKAEVEAYNQEVVARARELATPNNHLAVVRIREYYPEYQPEPGLIETPPETHDGNWWERHAARPTPEQCPGQYGNRHPANGTWCQMCGWHGKEAEVK